MDLFASWVLVGILVMLFGLCVWLDGRVQKLEDTVWELLMEKAREGLLRIGEEASDAFWTGFNRDDRTR